MWNLYNTPTKVRWCYFTYRVISFNVLIKPKGPVYFQYKCDVTSDDSHIIIVIQTFCDIYGINFYNDFSRLLVYPEVTHYLQNELSPRTETTTIDYWLVPTAMTFNLTTVLKNFVVTLNGVPKKESTFPRYIGYYDKLS